MNLDHLDKITRDREKVIDLPYVKLILTYRYLQFLQIKNSDSKDTEQESRRSSVQVSQSLVFIYLAFNIMLLHEILLWLI